ncbi:MAG: Gx transporter family protein [Butyricicoccus sp.]
MKKIAQGGLLVAVALVLSLIEKMFPLQAVIPIPGIKLGLANVVTLFALTVLGTRQAVVIVLCRVTLAAIFMGSITGFLFSLFGGLLALFVMRVLLLREGTWFSLVGVSIGGAAAHNIGQIFAAMLTLGTVDVAGYLPLLLLSAIPMGFVTGLTASAVLGHLKKIRF